MKNHRFLSYSLIWIIAAVSSFLGYVQDGNRGALSRSCLFLLAGVLYLYAYRKRKNNRRRK